MSKSLVRFALLLCLPLVLTACGDGWEVKKVSDYGAYGNKRTAGTGVAYVRAKLLPEKEFVVEPVMDEIKAETDVEMSADVKETEEVKPMEVPAPVLDAEEIFTEAQQKGVASEVDVKGKSDVEAGVEDGVDADAAVDGKVVSDDKSVGGGTEVSEKISGDETAVDIGNGTGDSVEKVEPEAGDVGSEAVDSIDTGLDNEASDSIFGTGEDMLGEEHSSYEGGADNEKVAEDYISQEPNSIVVPKVEVIKMTSASRPKKGSNVKMIKTAGVSKTDIEGVEIYENEVVQSRKYIIVPKKDMGSYLSVGEEELHEIYNQPF